MKSITEYTINESKDPIQTSVNLLFSELKKCSDDQDLSDVIGDFMDALEYEYEHNHKDGAKVFSLLSQYAADANENMD